MFQRGEWVKRGHWSKPMSSHVLFYLMFSMREDGHLFEKKECYLIDLGSKTDISLNSLVLSDFISHILVLQYCELIQFARCCNRTKVIMKDVSGSAKI